MRQNELKLKVHNAEVMVSEKSTTINGLKLTIAALENQGNEADRNLEQAEVQCASRRSRPLSPSVSVCLSLSPSLFALGLICL